MCARSTCAAPPSRRTCSPGPPPAGPPRRSSVDTSRAPRPRPGAISRERDAGGGGGGWWGGLMPLALGVIACPIVPERDELLVRAFAEARAACPGIDIPED